MGWTESSEVATLVKGGMLSIKASEVAILAAFCIHMLRKYPLPLHQSSMLAAGEALMYYLQILGRNIPFALMPLGEQQLLMDATISHIANIERAGLTDTPKHHYFMHLTHRMTSVWEKRETLENISKTYFCYFSPWKVGFPYWLSYQASKWLRPLTARFVDWLTQFRTQFISPLGAY